MEGLETELYPWLSFLPDIIFPRLNIFSFWVVPIGLVLFLGNLSIGRGRGTGWTLYPPLSRYLGHPSIRPDFRILALHTAGVGSLASAINFFRRIKLIKGPGLPVERMPILNHALSVTAVLLLGSLPVFAGGLTILLTDRHFGR